MASEVLAAHRQPVLAQVAEVAAGAVDADEAVPGGLVGSARVAVPLHPGLRRIEAGAGLADPAPDEVGLVGAHVAHGDVGLAPLQVAQRIRRDDLDDDARGQVAQPRQQRRQQVGGHHVARRDAHHAVHRLRLAGGGDLQFGGGRAHGACVVQQGQPGAGERHRLADALEERDAQARLDCGHLPAQCRLGQAELARGGRQRAGLGGFEKGLELVPVELIHTLMHESSAILGDVFA